MTKIHIILSRNFERKNNPKPVPKILMLCLLHCTNLTSLTKTLSLFVCSWSDLVIFYAKGETAITKKHKNKTKKQQQRTKQNMGLLETHSNLRAGSRYLTGFSFISPFAMLINVSPQYCGKYKTKKIW